MKPFLIAGLAAAALTLGACSGSHETASTVPAAGSGQTTHAHVRHLQSSVKSTTDVLGGAPGFRMMLDLFDAPLIGATTANAKFNAGILGVDAIDSIGDSWQLIAYSSPQIVNLLALQDTSLHLGTGSLPAGTYPAMQLLLDPATTTVTWEGQTYPVVFVDSNHPWWDPAQTVEAVRIALNVNGKDGDSIGATLDFNVFQSANLSNGIVYLTPTIAAGIGQPTIAGTVVNAAGLPVANATIVATDALGAVANTTVTNADGTFHVRGINPGSYTVSVLNAFTTNAGVTVTSSGSDPGAAPTARVVVGPNSQVNLGTLID